MPSEIGKNGQNQVFWIFLPEKCSKQKTPADRYTLSNVTYNLHNNHESEISIFDGCGVLVYVKILGSDEKVPEIKNAGG